MPLREKTVLRGLRHKMGFTATEDDKKLEISDLERNLCSYNKAAGQLRSYRAADPRLCFRICKNQVFSRQGWKINQHLSKYEIDKYNKSLT